MASSSYNVPMAVHRHDSYRRISLCYYKKSSIDIGYVACKTFVR